MSGASRTFPLHAGIATVAAVRRVTPAMTRITLHAPAFADPGIEQPGEIITLGWSPDGSPLALPGPGWRFPPGRREQHWRNFTVRRFDRSRATVAVDFFLHGDIGIASAWAARAAVGDQVGFAGPRADWQRDPAADWRLLLADETALPALLAILESLPGRDRALAVVEVADEAERQPLRCAADVDLRWVVRAGGTTVLLDVLRELALPPGPGQVWGGGEALVMRDVRRHLQARCPALSLRIRGYWKQRA